MEDMLAWLKRHWDKFINLDVRTETEKNERLDVFLKQICSHEISEEIKVWCNGLNVANILSHHFFTEIHHICSTCNINAIEQLAVDDQDELKPLRHYLLFSRGWKILYVVNSVGVKNLSCCQELSNLLISLLPICFKLLEGDESEIDQDGVVIEPEFDTIDSCFLPRSKVTLRKKFSKISNKSNESLIRRSFNKHAIDSDSSDSEHDLSRQSSFNSYLNTLGSMMDCQPADSSPSQPNLESKALLKISSTKFCNLLLNVVQKICHRDMLRQNLTTSPPSFTILPFALELVSSLYFCTNEWNLDDKPDIKCSILKLVYISAAAVTVQPGGLEVLEQQHSTIGVLTKLANYIFISKCTNTYEISFLFGILYGIIKLLCHITDWLSNRKYCGQVIRLLGSLTCISDDVWCLITQTELFKEYLIKLIENFGVLVSTVKRLKVIHIHNSRCLKRRHRKCHMEEVNHHHHNILGYPSGDSGEKLISSCCISYLCGILLNILMKTTDERIKQTVLSSMQNCGICCCLHITSTVDTLLQMFLSSSPHIQLAITALIEKVLLFEDSKTCTVCSIQRATPGDICSESTEYGNDTVDSAVGLSEGSTDGHVPNRVNEQYSFEIYRDLVHIQDSHLQSMICNHLVRLALKGQVRVKHALFYNVMLPIFLQSSDKSKCQNVIKKCLNVLPNLLQLSKNRNLFLNHGGIKHLKVLLDSSKHRKRALRILEVVIKSDLDENFDFDDPKSQDRIVIHHKNYLLAKSAEFTAKIDHEIIRNKSEELKSRKVSLDQPVLCVFDEQDELIEGSGEQLGTFSKSEIEHLFNLFTIESFDAKKIDDCELFAELQSLCDYWVCANSLLSSCNAYKVFLSDPSNLNVVTCALDLLEIVAAQLDPSSMTSKLASDLDYSKVQMVRVELLECLLLVCLQFTTMQSVKQLTTSRQMLKKIKDHLSDFQPNSSSDLKLVLDMLLYCALGQSYFARKHRGVRYSTHVEPSIELNSSVAKTMTSDDTVDYDADAEPSSSHDSFKLKVKSKAKTSNSNRILYAEVCRLLIDLMIDKCKVLLEDDSSYLVVYLQLFQRLNSYCSQSIYNARVMYKQNILNKLLDGFNPILTVSDEKLQDLQVTILTTFSLVSKTNISSKELQKIINFIKVPDSPVDILLQTLLTLVNGIRLQPTYLLSFPALLSSHKARSSSTPTTDQHLTVDSGLGISPIIDTEATLPTELHERHRLNTLPSPWAATSMVLPLPVDLIYQPKNKNFAFSLWMRVDNKSDDSKLKTKDGYVSPFDDHDHFTDIDDYSFPPSRSFAENIHLLSVGCSQLLFEVWICPLTNRLVFRMSRSNEKSYCVLNEVESSSGLFVSGHWHYLSVNVIEKQHKKAVNSSIELNVDGLFEQTLSINYGSTPIKCDMSSYVLIGQSCTPSEFPAFTGIWHLGNLMIFKDKVFTKESSLQMYALGPETSNLTSSSLGDDTVFISPHITPSALKQAIDWDVFIGADKYIPKLASLQSNLVLIFNAQNSSEFLLYPQPSNLASDVVGSLAQILPVINNLRSMSNLSKSSQLQPISSKMVFLSSRNMNLYSSMNLAICNLGGIAVFLFLFARIVECSSNEHSHACSLNILLRLLDKNPTFASDFLELNGYSLIMTVLANSKCPPTIHILKVLLDACTSNCIIDHEQVCSRTSINEDNEAIITNAHLLSEVIRNWKIWHGDLFTVLLGALTTLIRQNHPHRKFNLQQLQSIHALDAVIIMCKESFYFDDDIKFSKTVGKLILKLMTSLIVLQPVNANWVMSLCDLLLMLHNDTATFISTAHPSLYYLMSTYTGCNLPSNKFDTVDTNSSPGRARSATHRSSLVRSQTGLNFRTKSLERLKIRSNSSITLATDQVDGAGDGDGSNNDYIHAIELENGLVDHNPLDADDAVDEVDRKMQEAEDNLSSAIWYTPLDKSTSPSRVHSEAIAVPNKSISPKVSANSDSFVYIGSGELIFNSEDLMANRVRASSDEATSTEIIASDGDDWDEMPNKNTFPTHNHHSSDGLNLIRVGVLKMLKEVIMVAPAEVCNQLLGHVITADFLLVLCNHPDADARCAVVMVLHAYIVRSSENNLNSLIEAKLFHLLANQLSSYSVTSAIMDVLFSMVFGSKFSIEEPLMIDSNYDLKRIQVEALVPILCILPKTSCDITLCHNCLNLLKDMCSNIKHLTWKLFTFGLHESLMSTLLKIVHSEHTYSQVDLHLLLNDIKSLFQVITNNVMTHVGQAKFQVIRDLLHLLSHCERQEMRHCGSISVAVQILRQCQILVLQNSLDYIQHILNCSFSQSQSFFQSFSSRFLSRRSSFEKSVKDAMLSMSTSTTASLIGRLSKADVQTSTEVNNERKTSTYNENDLTERFNLLIQKSSNFILFTDIDFKNVVREEEIFFVRGVLQILIEGMASVMERTRGKKRNPWSSMMWSIRDTLSFRLGQLFVFLLCPLQSIEQRCYTIQLMVDQVKGREILKTIVSPNRQIERRIAIFVHDILYGQFKEELSSEQVHNAHTLVRLLELNHFDTIPAPPNTIDKWAVITQDKKNYVMQLKKECDVVLQNRQAPEYRLRHKYDELLLAVSESADNVTQMTILKKNCERKLFIENIRKIRIKHVKAKNSWRSLRDQLCHQRAVWYFDHLYPKSWQIDPTEGPDRVRKRLKRCHLNLKPKFFRRHCQQEFDVVQKSAPLDYLLAEDEQNEECANIMYRMNCDEVILYNCNCTLVSLVNAISGELVIGGNGVHFVPDNDSEQVTESHSLWKPAVNKAIVFAFEDIREILKRRYQLEDVALEVFLTNGTTHLISFDLPQTRNIFYDKLLQCDLPNVISQADGDSLQVTQMWRYGLITNFEYLTQLNKLAGRSFNDLMQYPVFPFVLSDYTSSVLDLLDPTSFRQLAKPMPIQDKSKEQYYIQMYAYLKRELDSSHSEGVLSTSNEPYHYSSLYSNSGNVLHFLVRLPPYTSLLVSYQDHNFDVPDRSFHSMETCWRISSTQAGTDVKELVPEFYSLPEFLLNFEGFDFGVRQSGECVDDVILPNWCRSNARLFIMIHRQALESNFVTEHINEWVDLVFGFKQNGRPAFEAINVFHPVTHSCEDIRKIEDPIQQCAMRTMIKTYGQMPKQLFQSRHPMVTMTINKQESAQTPQVIPEVQGLKWGSYVGSPAESEPAIVWRRNHRSSIGSFVPLSTNDVFGLGPHACLIVNYSKEKGRSVMSTTYVTAAALVSWNHSDHILRVKFRKDQHSIPIVKPAALDVICLCSSVPDCKLLFVGYQSGTIQVYSTSFDPLKPQLDLKKQNIALYGHRGPVLSICICRSFSIVVTSSTDGTIIIWDLNKLKYVRYIDAHEGQAVSLVAVSDTSADIVSVSDSPEQGSVLNLHTVNGSSVGAVTTSRPIHSVCFSNAPEGVSVNVIAAGMDNGVIKLWSSWDLVLVTEIRAEKFNSPVVCLVFSHDSQHLYAANDTGTVIIWEKPTKGFNKTPKFLPML